MDRVQKVIFKSTTPGINLDGDLDLSKKADEKMTHSFSEKGGVAKPATPQERQPNAKDTENGKLGPY